MNFGENLLNLDPRIYNVRDVHYWQMFLDRVSAYCGSPCTTHVTGVTFKKDVVELECTSARSALPVLNQILQAYELDGKLMLPDADLSGYKQLKAVWLYPPVLFEDEENCHILRSFIEAYYPGSLGLFTFRFLKHLNNIISLDQVVRRTGVSSVSVEPNGLNLVWPIHYIATETSEILESSIPGLSFIRDEEARTEKLVVGFELTWAALSGCNWSGDLDLLLKSPDEPFKAVVDHSFKDVDLDHFARHADPIMDLFESVK